VETTPCPSIVVIREKTYPSKAHPGFAWKWTYTVTIPGEQYSFSGDTLSWVRDLCKSKAPTLPIVLTWKPGVSGPAQRSK
jgi:hypothetical protein